MMDSTIKLFVDFFKRLLESLGLLTKKQKRKKQLLIERILDLQSDDYYDELSLQTKSIKVLEYIYMKESNILKALDQETDSY